ncbi:MAG: YkgJ family cysteine cluster protein [Promethearchaeota archaeon]
MNYENPDAENDIPAKEICHQCGGHCCTFGGAFATQNEVDAIIEYGYPNHFVRLSDGVYGTEWGHDGICPYLEDGLCSIYSLRPLGCRLFPVVQTGAGEIALVECPLANQLSEEEVLRRKHLLAQRPSFTTPESDHLRHMNLRELIIRGTKYNHVIL